VVLRTPAAVEDAMKVSVLVHTEVAEEEEGMQRSGIG
jgi:hypothetical protein